VEAVTAEVEEDLELAEEAEVNSNLSKLSLLHERKSVLQALAILHPGHPLGGYAHDRLVQARLQIFMIFTNLQTNN
jgi:hypothetical protein